MVAPSGSAGVSELSNKDDHEEMKLQIFACQKTELPISRGEGNCRTRDNVELHVASEVDIKEQQLSKKVRDLLNWGDTLW